MPHASDSAGAKPFGAHYWPCLSAGQLSYGDSLARLIFGASLGKYIERSPALRNMLWALEAGLLHLFWWASARLSPARASATGGWLARALGPHLDKTRQLKMNLRVAFPEKSDVEIDTLVRDIWGNLGAVLAEYPHLREICTGAGEDRLETLVAGDIEALHEGGKPAIFVSAHLANWEVCPAAGVRLGIPLTVLYTPMRNPRLDQMLLRSRQELGYGLLSRDADMREIVHHLSQRRSLGLIIDQRVDSGELVPFFGVNKATTLIPARLALRFGCQLVPVRVERLSGARFRVTFYDAVRPADGDASGREKAIDMMRKVNAHFEAWIREHPEQWLCSKRRWPKDITAAAAAGREQTPERTH
jgi:KDO2-lipid IV(A) lauroyltransferase